MGYALITGASSGIGKQLALTLAKNKIPTLLIAKNEQKLIEICQFIQQNYQVKSHYYCYDLSYEHVAKEIFERLELDKIDIDYLFNNAGYGLSGRFEKYSYKDYHNLIQVNVLTLIHFSKLFIDKYALCSTPKYLINIGSTTAFHAIPGMSVYAGSKSFVRSFTIGIARENQNPNLKIKIVTPGGTHSNFMTKAQITNAKAIKLGQKFNMDAQEVAEIIYKNLNRKAIEIIPGFMNKVHAVIAKFLPHVLFENSSKDIYVEK
ncbi:MAG: SDR family NAD(P)-dependent oxidoreductase [Alphaproteobacteria bacterium]|nr:SDR family NAD(P)-dependent oxidoreductase [Alphaproteobacteria bacterium]